MARTGPTTLALPPFDGATRQLILICVGVFFANAILGWVLPASMFGFVFSHVLLIPREFFRGEIWQALTYTFVPMDLVGELFTMLFLWFIGSMLEEIRGSRWLYELFFTSAIGGGVLACAIAMTGVLGLSPSSIGSDVYTAIYGLLVAIYVLLGEQEFLLLFVLRMKAKYMVAIYVLFDTARLLLHYSPFSALLHLSGALCASLFLKYIPRRGLSYGLSERYFGLRNDFYRAKRRKAAKKFEVYMREQNGDTKDPNDKRWMN